MYDLFENLRPEKEQLSEGIFLFPHYLTRLENKIITDIIKFISDADGHIPFRNMMTPGGHKMAVAITNAGSYGWVSDETGYRYSATDIQTGQKWLNIPSFLNQIVQTVAMRAGFSNFTPDSCLINRYDTGVSLGSHQDKDEQDFNQPIVSLSIGASAVFQNFGTQRSGKSVNIPLHHGDILIFGGAARKNFHGVKKLQKQNHPLTGTFRYNLTFRQAKYPL